MDIIRLFRSFGRFSKRQIRDNDFFSDRICHRHTTLLISVFVALATFRRFFSAPINCWIPAELRRYEKYITKYCWLKGTYYVHDFYTLEDINTNQRSETLLYYYQWVPLFLLFQAFLFYFPRIIWSFISEKILNYDIFDMVDAAVKYDQYGQDTNRVFKFLASNLLQEYESHVPIRRVQINQIARQKLRTFSLNGDENETEAQNKLTDDNRWHLQNIKHSVDALKAFKLSLRRSLLMFTYAFVKLMYLIVALLQLYLIDVFLSNSKYRFYGHQIVDTILSGQADIVNQADSKVFPRVTACDINIRELGTSGHHFTVQCILSLNLFNERIYAFLWFWICFIVLPFTVIDLVRWIWNSVFFGRSYRYKFMKRRLKVNFDLNTKGEKYWIKIFTEYFVGADGVFLLRLIERNSNAAVVYELIAKMWNDFSNSEKNS